MAISSHEASMFMLAAVDGPRTYGRYKTTTVALGRISAMTEPSSGHTHS